VRRCWCAACSFHALRYAPYVHIRMSLCCRSAYSGCRVSRITQSRGSRHRCAGLGDIAVPGLLAGLALRYDASRAVDMNGRAQAAGAAMQSALGLLKVLACLLSEQQCCSHRF